MPARHLGQVHPHFREVMQLLAVQCADEARHVEVFTRRATMRRPNPALSGAAGAAWELAAVLPAALDETAALTAANAASTPAL